jgi:hypothetical protein
MFAYTLAKELGYANVDVMLASITSKQFSEWLAFYKIQLQEAEQARLRAKAEARLNGNNR